MEHRECTLGYRFETDPGFDLDVFWMAGWRWAARQGRSYAQRGVQQGQQCGAGGGAGRWLVLGEGPVAICAAPARQPGRRGWRLLQLVPHAAASRCQRRSRMTVCIMSRWGRHRPSVPFREPLGGYCSFCDRVYVQSFYTLQCPMSRPMEVACLHLPVQL